MTNHSRMRVESQTQLKLGALKAELHRLESAVEATLENLKVGGPGEEVNPAASHSSQAVDRMAISAVESVADDPLIQKGEADGGAQFETGRKAYELFYDVFDNQYVKVAEELARHAPPVEIDLSSLKDADKKDGDKKEGEKK
eukprot:jgi/Bigna1/74125/fgenesh1_pg.27_\